MVSIQRDGVCGHIHNFYFEYLTIGLLNLKMKANGGLNMLGKLVFGYFYQKFVVL